MTSPFAALSSVTLTGEQFAALMAEMRSGTGASNATTAEVARAVVQGPMSWRDMPKLDLAKPGEVDHWFLGFEVKLRAARIPEDRWAEKFEECPGVPPTAKAALTSSGADKWRLRRLHIRP